METVMDSERTVLPLDFGCGDETQPCKLPGVSPPEGRVLVPSCIPSTGEHHEPWPLTAEERAVYRERSRRSREAKRAALNGEGPPPIHPVNVPRLDPCDLMPEQPATG